MTPQMNRSEPRNEAKPSFLLRFFPSLTDLAFLLPIFVLFVKSGGAKMLLADGDTGLHIRTGDWILSHKQVPYQDLFSFTKPHESWFAWEWLWDVLFSLIHRFWGLSGVVLITTLILCLISALLFRLVRRYSNSDLIAVLLTVVAIESSTGHWLARPHVLSWLLTLIFLHTVERHKRLGKNNLWLLPILTIFWTNIHGSFLAGVIVLMSYAFGDLLYALVIKSDQPLWDRLGTARRYALFGLLCLLATLVNPYGIALHQHVGMYLLDSKQLDSIGEFQSINFRLPSATYFEILLGLGVGAAIWCVRTGRFGDALLVLFWGHLALKSFRYIPYFAFVSAGPISATLRSLSYTAHAGRLSGWFKKSWKGLFEFGREFQRVERVGRFHLPAIASILLLALLLRDSSAHPRWQASFDSEKFPVAAVTYLKSGPPSRLFACDQWGDYLIYRLYPTMKVFVDDRSDFYGAEFSDRWVRVIKGSFDWQQALTKYGIDSVLLKTDDPLASVVKESPSWKTTFDDGVAIILSRKQPVERYASATPLDAIQDQIAFSSKGRKLQF